MINNGLSIYTLFQYSKGTVSKQNLKSYVLKELAFSKDKMIGHK